MDNLELTHRNVSSALRETHNAMLSFHAHTKERFCQSMLPAVELLTAIETLEKVQIMLKEYQT